MALKIQFCIVGITHLIAIRRKEDLRKIVLTSLNSVFMKNVQCPDSEGSNVLFSLTLAFFTPNT